MEKLYIPPTNKTPEVNFDFSSHKLEMRGESFPENAMAFYAPIRAHLADYLPQVPVGQKVEASFALAYFNSSSTKLIRSLFALLNDAASSNGIPTTIHWQHDAEDDMMLDFGKDLKEEFNLLDVRILATDTRQ